MRGKVTGIAIIGAVILLVGLIAHTAFDQVGVGGSHGIARPSDEDVAKTFQAQTNKWFASTPGPKLRSTGTRCLFVEKPGKEERKAGIKPESYVCASIVTNPNNGQSGCIGWFFSLKKDYSLPKPARIQFVQIPEASCA